MSAVHITAAYAFFPIKEDSLPSLHDQLTAFGEERGMRGLILIATEGINATVSGNEEGIAEWKNLLRAMCPTIEFKDSSSDGHVFSRWSVKIKKEIVALKQSGISPDGKRGHISPTEWNRMLNEEDVVVVDARNDYEYQLGRFTDAINPAINHFHQFSDFLAKAEIPKEKKVLVYCTGGIRCEKALIAMEQAGYKHVYQLDGGILKYLEECPEQKFEGECFVFDERVAVDQHLRPSSVYTLCAFHGTPAKHAIYCAECDQPASVCDVCFPDSAKHFCSKRCGNERTVIFIV